MQPTTLANRRRARLRDSFDQSSVSRFRMQATSFDCNSVALKYAYADQQSLESSKEQSGLKSVQRDQDHLSCIESIVAASQWDGMAREMSIEANRSSSTSLWTTPHSRVEFDTHSLKSDSYLTLGSLSKTNTESVRESYLKSRRHSSVSSIQANHLMTRVADRKAFSIVKMAVSAIESPIHPSHMASPSRPINRLNTARFAEKLPRSNEVMSLYSDNSSVSSRSNRSHIVDVRTIIENLDSRFKEMVVQTSRVTESHATLRDDGSIEPKSWKTSIFDSDGWRDDKNAVILDSYDTSKQALQKLRAPKHTQTAAR